MTSISDRAMFEAEQNELIEAAKQQARADERALIAGKINDRIKLLNSVKGSRFEPYEFDKIVELEFVLSLINEA